MSGADNSSEFPAGPKPSDRNQSFFDDPIVDDLIRSIVSLTMELSVTRERLQAIELMLEKQGKHDEGFAPDEEANMQQADDRKKLITDILGPIVERLAKKK